MGEWIAYIRQEAKLDKKMAKENRHSVKVSLRGGLPKTHCHKA